MAAAQDKKMAAQSLAEEEQAQSDYRARAKAADSELLKGVFEHNLKEEGEHAAALRKATGRVPYKHARGRG